MIWPMTRRIASRLLPIVILVLGLALRLGPYGQNRFLEDEALYSYWGLRIAGGEDPMLDYEPVDKPPLYPYTLALGFALCGDRCDTTTLAGIRIAEAVARLPSLVASLVSIALVYALAKGLAAPSAGRGGITAHPSAWAPILASLLLAFSPFDILFASTAFTDPMMSTLALGSLLAAVRGRPGVAGIVAGLALATKQQAILFLPLVLALLALTPARRSLAPGVAAESHLTDGSRTRRCLVFLGALALVAAGTMGWGLARQQRPGFLQQGLISYGGLDLAQASALGERTSAWLRLLGQFWVSPWVSGLLLSVLALWIGTGALIPAVAGPTRADLAVLAFAVAFLLLHWLLTFQIWDRYLLCVIPLVAILSARAVTALVGLLPPGWRRQLAGSALAVVLVCALAGPASQAARSELPIGGDHGAYDGIDALAVYLRNTAQPGTVLYHHWLGYHYRFYLYAAPFRFHWYPEPQDLVSDATAYRRLPRYIAFPSWRDKAAVQAALADAGIQLVPADETVRRDGTVSFRLLQLEGP